MPLLVEGEPARAWNRNGAENSLLLRVHEQKLIESRETDDDQIIAHRHSADVIAPFELLTIGWRRRCELIFQHQFVFFGLECGQADFADFGFRPARSLFVAPGRGSITEHILRALRAVVAREVRRAGPVAADPSDAALFAPVEVHPREAVAALAHVAAQKNERLAARRAVAGHGQGGLRRRMIREPCAGLVGDFPRGMAGVVDGKLVNQIHCLAPQPAHAIAAGRDKFFGNMIQPMLRRLAIAQQIIHAIPPDRIFAGRELRLRDQIANAFSVRAFDDQRDKAKEHKLELKYQFTPPPPTNGQKLEWSDYIGGMAVRDNLIVVSLTGLDQLLFVDAKEKRVLGTVSVPRPRGLAFDQQGHLMVLSDKTLALDNGARRRPVLFAITGYLI